MHLIIQYFLYHAMNFEESGITMSAILLCY